MAEKTTREFRLVFRVLNMAQRDMGRALGAFAPALNALSAMFGRMATTSSRAFAIMGTAGAVAVGGLLAAFAALALAIKASAAALRAFIGFMKDAISLGTQFERAVVLIETASNLTGQSVFALGEGLAAIGIGALDAAKGVEVLVRAGLEGKEAADVFSSLALFSKAIGVNIGRSASLLVGAVRAFNLEAEDSTRVLKAFSFAILRTRFNFETFTTAFAFGGSAAAGFNRDLEGTITVMSLFFDMGLRASTVGTTIRNMLTRLAKPTQQAQTALARYGINLKGILAPSNSWADILRKLYPLVNDLEAATSLFGRRTAGFIVKLLQKMQDEAKKTGDIFTDRFNKMMNSGILFADVMRKRLNTVAGQFDVFRSQLETLKIQVFQAFQPALQNILVFINDGIFKLREAFKTIEPMIVLITNNIMGLGAALMDLLPSWEGLRMSIAALLNLIPLLGPMLSGVFLDFTGFSRRSLEKFNELLLSIRVFVLGLKVMRLYMTEGALAMRKGNKEADALRSEMAELTLAFGAAELKARGYAGAAKLLGTVTKKSASQQRLINEEVAKMQAALEKSMKKMREAGGVTKRTFASIQVVTSKALLGLVKAAEEGPGALADKMNDVIARFGPKLGMTLKAAFEDFVEGGIDQADLKKLQQKIQAEADIMGVLFGVPAAKKRKILSNLKNLGDSAIESVVKTIQKRPESILDAFIGGKSLLPREKSVLEAKFGGMVETIKQILGKEDLFEELGVISDEGTKQILALFKAFGTEVDSVNNKTDTLNRSIEANRLIWERWGKTLSDDVILQLKMLKEDTTMPYDELLRLSQSMAKLGPIAQRAQKRLELMSDTLREKLVRDWQLAVRNLDPNKARTIGMGIISIGDAIKQVQSVAKTLGERDAKQLFDALEALDTIPKEGMMDYLKIVLSMARGMKEFNESAKRTKKDIGKIGPVLQAFLSTTGQSLDQAIANNIEAVEKYNEIDKRIGKEVTQRQIDRATREAQIESEFEKRFNRLSKFGQQSVMIFGNTMKRITDSIGRAIVDKSFKFKEAFRAAIKDMIAQLFALAAAQAIIKPLFKGLFGGGFGGGLFSKIFGLQTGTGMMGARGRGGGDVIPALLSQGEIVFDRNASDLLREMIADGTLGGGGGDTYINAEIKAMDGASVQRVWNRKIVPIARQQLRDNTGMAPDVAARANRTNRRRRR